MNSCKQKKILWKNLKAEHKRHLKLFQKKSKCNLHCMSSLLTRLWHIIRMQRQLNALSWHFQAFYDALFQCLAVSTAARETKKNYTIFLFSWTIGTDHEYVILFFSVLCIKNFRIACCVWTENTKKIKIIPYGRQERKIARGRQ